MAMNETKELEIDVFGGLARLHFSSHNFTGPEGSDTRPGMGFDISFQVPPRPDVTGRHYAATGVIGRADARALRDHIDKFLQEVSDEKI